MNRTIWVLGALAAGMAACLAGAQEAELVVQLEAEQKGLSDSRAKLTKEIGAIRDRVLTGGTACLQAVPPARPSVTEH